MTSTPRLDVVAADRALAEVARHVLTLLTAGKTQQAHDLLLRAVKLRDNAARDANRRREIRDRLDRRAAAR